MRLAAWLIVVLVSSGTALAGPITVSPPVSQGAVLQRGAVLTILGTADPGALLSVELGEARVTTRGDGKGGWSVRLGPFAAQDEPMVLTVSDANGEAARVADLLIGDVFVASGQSNMAWALQHAAGNNAVLRRQAPPERLRLYREPPRCADGPLRAAGGWTGSGWADAKRFSAIGYHFGRAYADMTDVPVGIILAARGGSPISAWLPPDRLDRKASGERADRLAERDAARADFADAVSAWLGKRDVNAASAGDPPRWPLDGHLDRVPGCHWDGMLAGLTRTQIAGVLWYQGETDAHRGTRGYAAALKQLIAALREAWGAELPVLVFGLPPYEPVPATAEVRAAQEAVARSDARTALVSADDPAADPLELHPRPKRGPAERAAVAMRQLTGVGPNR